MPIRHQVRLLVEPDPRPIVVLVDAYLITTIACTNHDGEPTALPERRRSTSLMIGRPSVSQAVGPAQQGQAQQLTDGNRGF